MSPVTLRTPGSEAKKKRAESRQSFLFLPHAMRERCFAPEDLERLARESRVVFTDSDDRAELLEGWEEHASNADVIITGWDSPAITDRMLGEADRLGALVHAAGSLKAFVPAGAWENGIHIASCNDALSIGVAESTLGMIIAGLKGFFPCSQLTRSGRWQAEAMNPRPLVRETYGMCVGVIGASKSGRHLIRLLRNFSLRIMLYDPYVDAAEAAGLGVQLASLEELVAESDVVTLHAPLLPSTRHMLRAEHFAAMKDDAIFINTARAAITDESALAEELSRGRLFAFIDVTETEPPRMNHPFRHLPNVVLLPHIAGALTNGCLRMGQLAVDQALQFFRGERMAGEISRELSSIMA